MKRTFLFCFLSFLISASAIANCKCPDRPSNDCPCDEIALNISTDNLSSLLGANSINLDDSYKLEITDVLDGIKFTHLSANQFQIVPDPNLTIEEVSVLNERREAKGVHFNTAVRIKATKGTESKILILPLNVAINDGVLIVIPPKS